MVCEELSWKNSKDQKILARYWLPDEEPKAIVILVHGLGEHTGRYHHVGKFFTEQGYALYGFDIPGHGLSDGIRGHADFDEVLHEIDRLILVAQNRFPGKPVFIYGHSMGATLTLYYLSARNNGIKGTILSGIGFRPGSKIPAWKLFLAKTLNGIFPTLVLANGLDRSNLSRDPKIIENYINDPLVHDRVSARLGWHILSKGERLLSQAGKNLPTPMLILQGTLDHLVSPQAVYEFASRSIGEVTLHKMEGYFHEVHNEFGKEAVIQSMTQWIEAHNKN